MPPRTAATAAAAALLLIAAIARAASPSPVEPRMPENFTYGIPLAFRNPYNDRMFKSVNTTLDRHFVFPSPVNVTLFTSFKDFLNKIDDVLHPYAFQFSESHVREVLGGVFDLARAVLSNPPNATSAHEFAEMVLSDPLSKTRLEDCMSKCPNPDVYEPYPNPFLKTVTTAVRGTDGMGQTYEALRHIPGGEGLKRHDVSRILDTAKYKAYRKHEEEFDKYNSTKERELTSRWSQMWAYYERAELVGNENVMKRAQAEIANLTKQLEEVRKAGIMWRWGHRHSTMFNSAWEMDDFSRYLDWTPNVMDPLEWFLDHFPSPLMNSGKFYYPPGATREWHTNIYSGGVGWRAYVVRRWPPGTESGTNMLHINTGEVLRMVDQDEMTLNLFRISDIRAPNWHCVYSKNAHRFSLGMKMTNQDIYRILIRTGNALPDPEVDKDAEEWTKKYDEKFEQIIKNDAELKRQYQLSVKLEKLKAARDELAGVIAGLIFNDTQANDLAEHVVHRVIERILNGNQTTLIDKVINNLVNSTRANPVPNPEQ